MNFEVTYIQTKAIPTTEYYSARLISLGLMSRSFIYVAWEHNVQNFVSDILKKPERTWVPEAHAYNPSYSGGRDQEDVVQSQPGQIVCKTLS
jgi:hypothetical protein